MPTSDPSTARTSVFWQRASVRRFHLTGLLCLSLASLAPSIARPFQPTRAASLPLSSIAVRDPVSLCCSRSLLRPAPLARGAPKWTFHGFFLACYPVTLRDTPAAVPHRLWRLTACPTPSTRSNAFHILYIHRQIQPASAHQLYILTLVRLNWIFLYVDFLAAAAAGCRDAQFLD